MKNRIKNAAVKANEWTKDHAYEMVIFGTSAALLAASALVIVNNLEDKD